MKLLKTKNKDCFDILIPLPFVATAIRHTRLSKYIFAWWFYSAGGAKQSPYRAKPVAVEYSSCAPPLCFSPLYFSQIACSVSWICFINCLLQIDFCVIKCTLLPFVFSLSASLKNESAAVWIHMALFSSFCWVYGRSQFPRNLSLTKIFICVNI